MNILDEETLRNRCLGCMIGLAVGDALGAPVEFLSLSSIKVKYGNCGIADFDAWDGLNPGSYTDDAQMSLATALGCLDAKNESEIVSAVHKRYLEWYDTQTDPFQSRAPGSTCMSALASGQVGTIDERINDSKGCGGVMRTAPVGLVLPPGGAFRVGAECAAITHGHPSGYLPAGFLSEMISHIIQGKDLSCSVELSISKLKKYEEHEESLACIMLARELSGTNISPDEAISRIGEGWVGEEALGISVYCALKSPNDWRTGVLASVNHSGDSDSTGCITGAILGAFLGVSAIPEKWVSDVEDFDRISNIAEALHNHSLNKI